MRSRGGIGVGALVVSAVAVACSSQNQSSVREPLTAHSANSAAESHAPPPIFEGEIKDDETARYLREHFTKYEARIPMRDGVRLYTQYFVPKDSSRTYPILFKRTPYDIAPYGVDAYPTGLVTSSRTILKAGYIFALQDVRGQFQSEGAFVNMRPYIEKKTATDIDETTDAYDSIDWLVKNVPKNNGRVGTIGTSYSGFYAAMSAIDAHPALKAVSPQAPIADWFLGDDMHHNGALFLAPSFGFFAEFGKFHTGTKKWPDEFEYPTTDGYDFYLREGPLASYGKLVGPSDFFREAISHESYDDFWKSRATLSHLKNIAPAVMTVGGWFDAEDLWGTLATYRAIESQGAKSQNTIVMGPWRHGGWQGAGESLGNVSFGAKTADFFREKIMAKFFEATLQEGKASPLPEAWAFQTGTNEWKSYDAWPPKNAHATTFYLREGETLSTDAPPSANGGDLALADSYVSDPMKPVPYRETPTQELDAEYMTDDQRFASRRPDVLVYRGDVLAEDLAVTGPIDVTLYVTTSSTDSDFVVKVVDVHSIDAPDLDPNPRNIRMAGYEELVRGDVFRGRFRESFEHPIAFRPNEPAKIHFTMPDVNHVFRSGHRLMVQVQSSWFPLVDRNPQTFVDIHTAKQADFVVATERILRSRNHASQITMAVLAPEKPTSKK